MIRVKLTLLTQQTLLHTTPSHQDEPFQSTHNNIIFLQQQISYSNSVQFRIKLCNLHCKRDIVNARCTHHPLSLTKARIMYRLGAKPQVWAVPQNEK